MTTKNFFPLLAAMVMVLAAGMANAQIGGGTVKADVPFAFTIANQTLPAGQYTVRKMSELGTLAITSNGSALAMIQSNRVESASPQKLTKLVFHKYGDRYFLYQIWVQGEDAGREVPRTPLERELASNRKPNSVAVLAAK
jgi:hypothetical protein